MKKKKKKGFELSKRISNRLSYTIIAFVGLMLIGVFVFATAPNPGHDYTELDLGPIDIKGNNVEISDTVNIFEPGAPFNKLEVAGGVKATRYCIGSSCIDDWSDVGGSGGFWSKGQYGGIYYSDRVGIAGNTGPTGLELDVNGQIGADSYCDGAGRNCKTIAELSSGGGSDSDWVISGNNMYSGVSGKVGIGTSTPNSKLSVGGSGVYNAAIYGEGGEYDYGVYGKGRTGVYGKGDTTGVYGKGELYGVHGTSSILGYGVYGEGGNRGVYGVGTDEGVYGSGQDYGVYGYSGDHVGVYGYGKTYDFYAGGQGYGPFTGAHDVILSSDFPSQRNVKTGMIVSVTGETKKRYNNGTLTISTTLPTVSLSNKPYDRRVFGAFVAFQNLTKDNWYYNYTKPGERFGIVNALGEGRVWVTNVNGEIEAGDYITTSEISGYGMKQDDDLLHSYTLGKATEDVDWSKIANTITYNGKKYKAYPIGVVYTSG